MEGQPDKTLSGTASVRLAPLAEYTDGSPETSSAPHEPRATRPRHYVRSAASFITSGTPSTSEEVSVHTHRRIIHVRRPRGQRLPPLASTLTAATTDVSQREGCGGDDGENVSGAVEEDDDDDDDDGLTPAAVPRRPPRGRSAPADRRRRRQRSPHHRGTTPELTRGRSAREDALCRAWGHFLFGAVRELVVVDASGAAVGGASASASSSSSWRMWDPWAKSGVKDEGVAVVRLRVPLSCCWNIPRPTALMEMEEGSDWSSECTGEEEGSSSSDDEGSVVGGSDVVGLWRQRFDAHASVAASQPGCFRLYCGSRVVSARLLSDEGASPCTWSTNVGWRVVSEVVGNGVCGEVP